jgi:hypothetical protein
MNADDWWWAVYDMLDAERMVDSSNEYGILFPTGISARTKAETVATAYLKRKFGDNNNSL